MINKLYIMEAKCQIISQSTGIKWRTAIWSPFQELKEQKKKKFIKRQNFNVLERQYTKLAEQSIKRDYELTNLTPYTSLLEIHKIKNEISGLSTVSHTRNLSPEQKQTLKEKIKTLASKYELKKLKISKEKEAQFFKSALENKELDLFEDFNYDMSEENAVKEKIVNKVNQSFEDNFPKEMIIKRGKRKGRNIFKLKKNDSKCVTQPFDSQNDLLMERNLNQNKTLKISFNKEDIGVFSKSKNKLFKYKKMTSEPALYQREFSVRGKKEFYGSYLKSYCERKKILKKKKAI